MEKNSLTQNENQFNQSHLLYFIFRHRKIFILVGLITFIGSALISLLIPNRYSASVIMFPTSTNAISKALLTQTTSARQDLLEFGEEEQAEQMLQILHSNEIRDKVITKFNLLEHYRINPNSKNKLAKLYKAYENNITFRRTKYMAVEIRVTDKDPQLAADIANYIANLYDTIKNNMQKQRSMAGYYIVLEEYNSLFADIERKKHIIDSLSRKGIQNYEKQTERLYEGLAREIGKGNSQAVLSIQKQLDTLAKYGTTYITLTQEIENDLKKLSELKAKLSEARVDAYSFIPQKFIVNNAYKPEKKSFPPRTLIVIISTVSSLLLLLILLLLLETIKGFRTREKTEL
ncbi:MAG: Wzz/FepE/Etk N-terminal domain-containing protein [Bacteroidales bacterium]|nr:Wzz/FepE/Etk N-terminal domain-containing protein [Bacteroidales bacterium]